MVFRQLLGAFGVGGPSVETVLTSSHCRPGEYLAGEVRIQGGDRDAHIDGVVLSLVTEVEVEHDDHEGAGVLEFWRGAIAGGFVIGAGRFHAIPFRLPVPWELPITEVYGRHLHGMTLGVRTELEVAGQLDKGDLDLVSVVPLPSQQRVLDAFAELGFQFKSADVEHGHVAGLHQELPFYQEIEFYAPPQYSGHVNEVELTFVADPHGLAVVLEADRRSDLFSEGGDSFGRFQVSHDQALYMAWEHELTGWLQAVVGHLSGGHGFHAHHEGHGGHGSYGGHGHHGDHGDHGGPGWGGVAAGAVGGAVAGFAAGAVVNEMLDSDDDSDEDRAAEAAAEAAQAAAYQEAVEEAVEEAYEDAYEDAIAETVEDAYEDAIEEAVEEAYEDAYEEAVESFEDEE